MIDRMIDVLTGPYLHGFIVVVVTLLIGRLVRKLMNRFVHKAIIVSNNPTGYRFLGHIVVALIYVIGFGLALSIIPQFKQFSGSLLAGAGLLAAAVGFASQEALSNIVAGVFITVFKPFRIHDRVIISEGTITGVVEDINLRHTVIRNFENQRVVIPNGILSKATVVNSDLKDSRINRVIDFDIGLGASISDARAIIAKHAMAHVDYIDGRTSEDKANGAPEVPIRVVEWGPYYIRLRAWVWSVDVAGAFRLKCDILESIKTAFDEQGIEIPYPYQNILIPPSVQPTT